MYDSQVIYLGSDVDLVPEANDLVRHLFYLFLFKLGQLVFFFYISTYYYNITPCVCTYTDIYIIRIRLNMCVLQLSRSTMEGLTSGQDPIYISDSDLDTSFERPSDSTNVSHVFCLFLFKENFYWIVEVWGKKKKT